MHIYVTYFSEPFKTRLEILWNFTPKYFKCIFVKNKDILLYNWSSLIKLGN